MGSFLETCETFLSHPILWGVVALLALPLVLSGRLSVTAAVWILWAAWLAASFGVYRSFAGQDFVMRGLLVIACSSILAIGAVWLSRWYVNPEQKLIAADAGETPIQSPNEQKPEVKPTDQPSGKSAPLGETRKAQQPKKEIGKPPTLSDLFKQDFRNVLKMSDEFMLTQEKDGVQIPIKRQVYMDFDAKTDFIGFYISSADQFSDETFRICQTLVDVVGPTILSVKQGKTQAWGGYKGQGTKSTELLFSGRVFIYHEGSLSITQKASLIESYESKGYDIQFRGLLDYGADQMVEWYHQHGVPQPDIKQP
jgi:hypothetical protein